MLPRSLLTLSTLALLATGGVMAAAGPGDMNKRGDSDDAKFRIHVDINSGNRGPGWGRPAPFHPPVVRVEPVIVEAFPATLDLQAFQAGDTVIVLARGENTTAGFTTSLERQWDRRIDGVARVTLRNYGPACTSPRAQVCSPFAVSGGFETRERLSEIRICIAGQERCVPVSQIAQMPGH